VSQPTRPLIVLRQNQRLAHHMNMKLAVLLLIAALCTASCTAITLAVERPKPQLQRANKESSKVLALRGGGLVQDICKSKSPNFKLALFVDCIQADNGLLAVFAWSVLYLFGALGWLNLLPGDFGAKLQNAFESIYRKQGELGYIRFEILFILSSLANTAVLVKFAGDSARLLRWSAAVWATTFTLIVIKFHSEKHMITKGTRDWPIIGVQVDLPYYGIQALHAVIAALVWYGVFTSK